MRFLGLLLFVLIGCRSAPSVPDRVEEPVDARCLSVTSDRDLAQLQFERKHEIDASLAALKRMRQVVGALAFSVEMEKPEDLDRAFSSLLNNLDTRIALRTGQAASLPASSEDAYRRSQETFGEPRMSQVRRLCTRLRADGMRERTEDLTLIVHTSAAMQALQEQYGFQVVQQ